MQNHKEPPEDIKNSVKLFLDVMKKDLENGDFAFTLDLVKQEEGECSACDGSGLFAKKTWHEPEIKCDECSGSGSVAVT